ncbi:adenylate/guanylate cyclase domain-containing protein [Mycobacterium sp. 236(2023)]|uniref:adenylate/guanylate cyclase domain-containing protein n=1 Tax=Mycobacterium sp. 236(2023) TaxID=3038163 RepID=UPI002414D700|nr:adenylate/guanylate cyclase domain-containing protein [Mycobacterium sp. 236(2023)]MDG4667938.1 adenylate/guanylate cyclase domain-containing protein [Mycobacterium sp. 236(2023)]
MGRYWQWLWDRHGRHYSWALIATGVVIGVGGYLALALLIVGFERSDHFGAAVVVTVIAVTIYQTAVTLLGWRWLRPVQLWAAGCDVDRLETLKGTYAYSRKFSRHLVWGAAACVAAIAAAVGVIVGASAPRIFQYAVLGALHGAGASLTTSKAIMEAALWPVRMALIGDSDIGDGLPRSRPSFATQVNRSMVALAFIFTMGGTLVVAVYRWTADFPVLLGVVAGAITLLFGVPFAVGNGLAPRLRPIRDLAAGADRVAAGDYSQRLPVGQDDDLGVLAAAFNRMQAGLAERQRLRSAFGSYVDPALAARLLEQGDEVFSGERREVTLMFLDVRDFTPFAEANTAEDTVARLNDLFSVVVPAVVDAGGHLNKFLGDGAMAVFGAPNHVPQHADAAVSAAVTIHARVAERFDGDVRIGIGINTGVVIAGTIGAAGHLEYALIGDTTNVAARVEQLTKITGDPILLTGMCVDALSSRPSGLVDRGAHALKGKSASTRIYGLTP